MIGSGKDSSKDSAHMETGKRKGVENKLRIERRESVLQEMVVPRIWLQVDFSVLTSSKRMESLRVSIQVR